jgi:biopolymer transport protein ExbD
MVFDRLRTLLAPALASLFLILVLCAIGAHRPASVGFRIPIILIHHHPQEPTDCEGRAVFLRLTKDGRTWINDTELPESQLASEVAEVMENRAERVVYVVVDSELPYGQFAQFLDKIAGATTDLHLVVVSGEIRRAFEKNHDLCDFVYPGKEFTVNGMRTSPAIQRQR